MSDSVTITVDNIKIQVPKGISVAAAVLGHSHVANERPDDKESHTIFHNNSMSAEPRSPYCLMGVCFECMLEIDGVENVQSCLVEVKEGMTVKRGKNPDAFKYTSQEDFAHERTVFSKNGVIDPEKGGNK